MARITVDEWIAELERINPRQSDEGLTALELASAWSVSKKTAYDRLHALKKAGRVIIGRRATETLDGRESTTPVYRLKKGKK